MSINIKCNIIHPQINHGCCPHCGLIISISPSLLDAGARPTNLNWNFARLMEDLDKGDETVRLESISNFLNYLPPLAQALPVVQKGIQDRAERVRNQAFTAAVRLSMNTESHITIEICEIQLRQNPTDIASLYILLHCYTSAQCDSKLYLKARHSLILKVIEIMPDFPRSLGVAMKLFPKEDRESFDQAKNLWMKQIQQHPNNIRVIENASMFFRIIDDVMAGELLRKCKAMDAGNSHWSRELGQLYSFQGDIERPESYKDWGLMSLAELESDWQAATNQSDRFHSLMKLPVIALQSGQLDKASYYANELLSASSEHHNEWTRIAFNREAHMVLGGCSLHANNLNQTRDRLMSAMVPNMSYFVSCYCFMDPIIKLLVWAMGRNLRSTVLEYLHRDQLLVPEFSNRLSKWASEIELGLTPNFQNKLLLSENLKLVRTCRQSV